MKTYTANRNNTKHGYIQSLLLFGHDDLNKLVGCGMIHTQKYDELNKGVLLGENVRLVGYGNNYKFNFETLESSSPTPRYEHILSLLLHCHNHKFTFKTGDV